MLKAISNQDFKYIVMQILKKLLQKFHNKQYIRILNKDGVCDSGMPWHIGPAAKRKLVTVIQPMNKGLIMVHAHRYTMETFIMVFCSTADF